MKDRYHAIFRKSYWRYSRSVSNLLPFFTLGGDVKYLRRSSLALLVVASIAQIVGCSDPVEPTPEAKYYHVDAATGVTSIDTSVFKTVLMSRRVDDIPTAEFPQLVVCQEYAEANEEIWAEVLLTPQLDSSVSAYFNQGLDDVQSVEDAMQMALQLRNIKEALPENSRGNFADKEMDSTWDAAIGSDNKLSDKAEALNAAYAIATFSVKKIKERRASATYDATRFILDVQLAAAQNHLLGIMRVFSAEQIMLPQTGDLPQEEVEKLRSRSVTREWFTPP